MAYSEEDMLMLSGIQHYLFCPRQWALIHIEQQWKDNRLTLEGQILHTNVDNPRYRQKNGKTITLHAIPIASKTLGLYGISDAIELLPAKDKKNAITHSSYSGYWRPYPIEYKRGHHKPHERDEVQLAAQVICLEEMYQVQIDEAALYYGETKHREVICINKALRELTYKCAQEMHTLYKNGCTPRAIKKPSCRKCSLIDTCMPSLSQCSTVKHYLIQNLYEETT